MSTTVCLAVLLGAAMPAASSPTFEDSPQTGEQRARFVAPDFEQLASAPRRDIPRWIDRLPRVEFPAGLRNNSGTHETAFLVRGQSPPYDPSSPGAAGNPNLAQTMTLPPVDGNGSWIPNQGIWGGTPMLNPNGMMGGGQPQAMMAGVNGPRPYRFGWQSSFDVGYLPKEDVEGGGNLGVFEFNTEMRHTTPAPMQHIFSIAPQYNFRAYNGSDAEEAHRFGLDLRLTSPAWGPFTWEIDFNPSVGTDFERNLTSDAWMFDVRGALFYRATPQHLIVLGVMYWDRVNDRVLPYAGVVFTPNQYLEIRAMFPKSEISLFLGTPWGVPQWLYLAGEYHVEAYQFGVSGASLLGLLAGIGHEQIQFEDWRAVLGVRSEHMGMTSFLEAGWVFSRDIEAKQLNLGTDLSSGFIVRFGVRY